MTPQTSIVTPRAKLAGRPVAVLAASFLLNKDATAGRDFASGTSLVRRTDYAPLIRREAGNCGLAWRRITLSLIRPTSLSMHETLSGYASASGTCRSIGQAFVARRNGDPSRTRTCNPRSRNPLLYPVELWDRCYVGGRLSGRWCRLFGQLSRRTVPLDSTVNRKNPLSRKGFLRTYGDEQAT